MSPEISITVVVDYVGRKGLRTSRGPLRSPSAVGLSIYLEAFGRKVLFDTSSSWDLLLYNAESLEVDLRALDAVVISHWHIDHTGGLPDLMRYNVKVPVYAPPQGTKLSPLDMFVHFRIRRRPTILTAPTEILENIYTIGPLSGSFPFPPFRVREQALAVRLNNEEAVLLVGCSHPKPYRFVEETLNKLRVRRILLLMGGLHLIFPTTKKEALRIVRALYELPIKYIAPLHCTGDQGKSLVRHFFKDRYLDVVAGDRLLASPGNVVKEG
jgi:7,8-dihydropterin-6-yl-methyl-4-(beta-D-ribofuranosyl)aminobenzene 5'-phosphate synthase